MGITFFPEITLSKLPEVLQLNYDYFVLDMGILNPYTAYEFTRCNLKLMVGDLSPWKKEKTLKSLEQILQKTNIHQEQVIFLGNPMIKESISSRYVKGFSKIMTVPYISNPFHLSSKDFVFYEHLLKGY